MYEVQRTLVPKHPAGQMSPDMTYFAVAERSITSQPNATSSEQAVMLDVDIPFERGSNVQVYIYSFKTMRPYCNAPHEQQMFHTPARACLLSQETE